jgi:GLPGLI family protein
MRTYLILLLLIGSLSLFAQKNKYNKIAIVEYLNGNISDKNGTKTIMYYKDGILKVYAQKDEGKMISIAVKETSYVNYKDSLFIKKAKLKENKNIFYSFPLAKLYNFQLTEEYKEILGYKCRKAIKVSFSNKIIVWFTIEAGIKGGPNPSGGLTDGLIMSISRNGSAQFTVTNINYLKEKKSEEIVFSDFGQEVSYSDYRFMVQNNYITKVCVFKDVQLAWVGEQENPKEVKLNHIYKYHKGTLLLKKIKLPEVSTDYQVFVKITQYSNGDAYDRTGTVFIIPDKKKISAIDAFLQGNVDMLPVFVDNDPS